CESTTTRTESRSTTGASKGVALSELDVIAISFADGASIQMRVTMAKELVIRITHRLRLSSTQHDLDIDRLEAVILEPMDDACRTRKTIPGSHALGDAMPRLILDEDGEDTLEHEEYFLAFMGMGSVALTRGHKDDAHGEGLCRDDVRIIMLP